MSQKGKIYPKGNRWYFRYQRPEIANGQRVWKDVYVNVAALEDYPSAAAVEKAGLVSKYRDDLDPAKTTASMTQFVSDFVEKVYFPTKETDASQPLRPSTLNGYKHLFERHLKARLSGIRMREMRLPVAQQLLNSIAREQHLSSNSLRHIKWFAVAVFNFAAQHDAFDSNSKNPFFDVEIPKSSVKTVPTRHATLDDIVAMIDALDEPAATVVAMAAFSGLRKSEIQGLRWEDLKSDMLYVRRTAWRTTQVEEQTKTAASEAPVPVIKVLAKYLEAHRNGFPAEGFIFAGPKKQRPLDLHNLANRIIRPTLAEKKIAWCGWHGFRRGLATTLYELGTEDKTRQAILRHADVNVTEKFYTKAVDAVSQKAMAKVQKAFDAKLKQVRKVRKHGKG